MFKKISNQPPVVCLVMVDAYRVFGVPGREYESASPHSLGGEGRMDC